MATFIYRSQPAIDQDGNLASVGTGQVFAITDTTFMTPLTVTKPGGVTGTDISVSQLSLTETFSLEDRAEVWWKSGSLIVHLASISGMLAAVESSAQAAQIASLAAQSAPSQLPLGGDTGQVLGKLSTTDRDVGWIDGGTGGGGGGGTGDAMAADVYAVRRWTAEDGWPPANRGTYGGVIWLGPTTPAPADQQEHDIRLIPTEG